MLPRLRSGGKPRSPGVGGWVRSPPPLATNRAPPAPASAPTNGKLVTLEELAQMVRRRKPRLNAVPEGQLALFGM